MGLGLEVAFGLGADFSVFCVVVFDLESERVCAVMSRGSSGVVMAYNKA